MEQKINGHMVHIRKNKHIFRDQHMVSLFCLLLGLSASRAPAEGPSCTSRRCEDGCENVCGDGQSITYRRLSFGVKRMWRGQDIYIPKSTIHYPRAFLRSFQGWYGHQNDQNAICHFVSLWKSSFDILFENIEIRSLVVVRWREGWRYHNTIEFCIVGVMTQQIFNHSRGVLDPKDS